MHNYIVWINKEEVDNIQKNIFIYGSTTMKLFALAVFNKVNTLYSMNCEYGLRPHSMVTAITKKNHFITEIQPEMCAYNKFSKVPNK